jgi:hypothetical protein
MFNLVVFIKVADRAAFILCVSSVQMSNIANKGKLKGIVDHLGL